jgi:hypothetical protein
LKNKIITEKSLLKKNDDFIALTPTYDSRLHPKLPELPSVEEHCAQKDKR